MYTWKFGEYGIWGNGEHETIEECLIEAKRVLEDGEYYTDKAQIEVYIGECVPYIPEVDAVNVLDNIKEQAYSFTDLAEDWECCNIKKEDELEELTKSLSNVVNEWFKKYGYDPHFWSVEKFKKYQL